MTARRLRGLTWDHPRGRAALEWSSTRHPWAAEVVVDWEIHSLSGFETTPIHKLADDYDLIVLDHPHLGEATATRSLRPISDWASGEQLQRWRDSTVGSALDSYHDGEHLWALPLDVACQVSAYRPDRITSPPTTWEDTLQIRSPDVVLSLAGPHAILTLSSLCLAIGEVPAATPELYCTQRVGVEALTLLGQLAAHAHHLSWTASPIDLLEAMASTEAEAPSYCPLIFGYVNYSSTSQPHPVYFTDTPTSSGSSIHGSTLGGTGIAMTHRCPDDPSLLRYLDWLLDPRVQATVIAAHDGQPSQRAAWNDPEINEASHHFYRSTLATAESAWVRPRFPGWIDFQNKASELVRDWLATTAQGLPTAGPVTVIDQLNNAFALSQQAAGDRGTITNSTA